MDSKKINYVYLFVLTLLCSCRAKTRELIYFIPENYEGQVKITWLTETSKNKVFSYKDDAYVIIITGNPKNYRIKDEIIPSGFYNIKYYYYSKDTVYEINSTPVKDYLPKYPNAGSGYTGYVGTTTYSSFFVYKDSLSYNKKELQ